ncbi:SDR family NAD(P)-dependent oxidoreductase [Pseudomonas sp. HS6]|uniref:SDR family NAD(P)-dependent oxidoreductase n=1 Tax=Pseudomonas sp. HS6 TaxID=2850559 RepID=UPI002019C5A4|nr:SDR family NAD(P)-dependent oxidoreductase [Pseudomonas sp. HS6]UQS14765.1 SDR family NAD(P)-dependent oxidoreductase [Pseudomonas sp. HS6]
MSQPVLPFSQVASLVYAPKWQCSKLQLDTRPCIERDILVVVPAAQTATFDALKQWLPEAQSLLLTAENVERAGGMVESGAVSRIVFMSVTPWRDGVDDQAIKLFLQMNKRLAGLAHLRLDIVTVKSIVSPAAEAPTHPVDSVYMGLGQTAAKEFSGWDVRCFSLAAFTAEHFRAALQGHFPVESGQPVSLDHQQWWTPTLVAQPLTPVDSAKGFKQGGTYLIFGAAGGLGSMLAHYLASRYQARLILVGRRANADELLAALRPQAASVVYEQVDLTDAAAVTALMARYPQIDGIIHSALLLDDAVLSNMTEQALMRVLEPKLHGMVNLLNAVRGRDFDFVLLFSSIQSYIANAGQANYTAACVSKDALGGLLRDVLMVNTKVINWGYWGSIGIVASPLYRERMQKLQIGSIEAPEGLAIIEALLHSAVPQISVVKASTQALQRLRITPHPDVATASPVSDSLALLTAIVPTFDPHSEAVRRNIGLSLGLQNYARARLAQTTIPAVTVPRHAKLVAAINAISPSDGPTREQLLSEFPQSAGHVTLLDACLARYPQILSGEIDPLTVLFPEGSFALVEPVYRDNPLADYFNNIVAQVVDRFVRQQARPLQLLEVGAGTGSTCQFVLPVLRGSEATYTFTDLSHAFLNKARARFSEYGFVRYELCDIARPPTNDQRYDVIIATNVIHATADLPATLANVRDRLAPGGIFILNEITSCQDYATLTFGLTEGWWLSVDPYRIPNSPLVAAATWQSLLREAGFSATMGHGTEDQQVLVARLEPAGVVSAPVAGAAPSVDFGGDSRTKVEHWVRRVIADVLHAYEYEIDVNQPFNEYGVDSLIAMELLKPFKESLGYLPATVLFEHPTISRLAEHFLTEFSEQVQRAAGAMPDPAPGTEHAAAVVMPTAPAPAASSQQARVFLRQVIAETMLMEPDELEDTVPFKEYGIDSIISLELLKPLRERFGYLPATLLFEYPTVERLATYLEQHYPDAVAPQVTGPASMTTDVPGEPVQAAVSGDGMDTALQARADDLAVVGVAGQFPDADDVQAFWANLLAGRQCTATIPAQRWPLKGFENPRSPLEGGSYTSAGGFVRDVDAFDYSFFSITPLEAQRMDPQERLFLQNVYQTFADAGYRRADLKGSETGVFVGVMNGGYAWHRPEDPKDPMPTSLFWSIANRVSYLFDLKGPSMAIDTACSASLTALHLACQAVRNGDCSQALVGGVNLIVNPRHYEQLCSLHMLSRSGTCSPFGSEADGFVDGEGVCSILIKPYAEAIRANDRIYGVIRGTAINAGGQSNGYSAPNPQAQSRVVDKALERAGLTAADIDFVEAHGTGTELGDPIEIRGLSSVFDGLTPGSVAIGSVKGNVGHLESAAGMTGVIKVLKQLQARTLAPSINAQQINPLLNLASTPFYLVRQPTVLSANGTLYGSVSSFGAGGANAHAVLQSVPAPVAQPAGEVNIALLSARTEAGLQRQIDALHDWLEQHDPALGALSYTLCCAREHFAHREGYVFSSKAQLLSLLREDLQQRASAHTAPVDPASIAVPVGSASLTAAQAAERVQAFKAGQDIAWSAFFARREVISLPGYPFEKTRSWVKSSQSAFHHANDLVRQHSILGSEIAPAAWALAHCLESRRDVSLKAVTWRSVIRDLDDVLLDINGERFELRSLDHAQIYCEGLLQPAVEPSRLNWPAADTSTNLLEHQQIYRQFTDLGYRYGEDLRPLRWAKVGSSSVRTLIDVGRDWGYRISPALIDGGLQTAILIPQLQGLGADELLVPYHLGEFQVLRIPQHEAVFCHCVMRPAQPGDRSVTFDLLFSDGQGSPLIVMRELTSVVVHENALKTVRPAGVERDFSAVHRPSRIVAFDLD